MDYVTYRKSHFTDPRLGDRTGMVDAAAGREGKPAQHRSARRQPQERPLDERFERSPWAILADRAGRGNPTFPAVKAYGNADPLAVRGGSDHRRPGQ